MHNSVILTGLVDGSQDQLTFPTLYGIYISETELGGGNRTITLTGDFTPALYERVSVLLIIQVLEIIIIEEFLCDYNYYLSSFLGTAFFIISEYLHKQLSH